MAPYLGSGDCWLAQTTITTRFSTTGRRTTGVAWKAIVWCERRVPCIHHSKGEAAMGRYGLQWEGWPQHPVTSAGGGR